MGIIQSKTRRKWSCFGSPSRTGSSLELSSNPRNSGSEESIQSDKFDETQVIVHDIRTNKNYFKARHDVENDPDPSRYIPCPLQERSNEVIVEIPIDGISDPYQVCKLDFAELGLDTKRQQGLIPHIYVTRSRPPDATQSSAAANGPSRSATFVAQTSTRSSPSWKRRRGHKTSSSSASRPKPTTKEIAVQPQTHTSIPQSQPQPEQSSQHSPRHPLPHQHQFGVPPSSSRTVGVPRPAASPQGPSPASIPPLSISPMPNG